MGNVVPGMGKGDIGKLVNLNEAVPEDAKARALRRTMLIKKLNTGRCTTPQELAERFDKLFEVCLENGFIPVVESLALCSGWDRRTIHDIETGVSHKGDGMSDIIKEAKDFIATLEAELARDGEINSTVYIFRAKNFYGMSDKQEVVVTPNARGLEEPMNAQEILANVPQLSSGSSDK
jgi:hypothetical protein